MGKQLLEVATDKIGNILWIEDYQFSRLFGVGQESIVDSNLYITISCRKIGTIVYHVLRSGVGSLLYEKSIKRYNEIRREKGKEEWTLPRKEKK